MTEFDNTNRGSVWMNDRKESDTHADYTGTINIEGVEYWLNGWRKKPDANPKAPVVSFTVKKKEKQSRPQQAAAVEEDYGKPPEGTFDDIPF